MGNALFSAFNQQQYTVLDSPLLPAGKCHQLTVEPRVATSHRHQHTALEHNQLRIGDCLGRESMFVAKLKAKNVARQIEAADLATTVTKYLRSPHDTADDLVGVISSSPSPKISASEGNGIAAPIMCMVSTKGFCLARALTASGETRCVEIKGRDELIWTAAWRSMTLNLQCNGNTQPGADKFR
jgi:hypothetical protein